MKNKKLLFAGLLSLMLQVYTLSYGMNHKVHTADANYKLICDDLDLVGGKGSSPNYKLMVSAGGQSSPIGRGGSTNYKLLAGYIGATFVQRGDANADGVINIADVIYLVNYLFGGGIEPSPMEAGDANCDGVVNIADVIYLVNYLFGGGLPPCDP